MLIHPDDSSSSALSRLKTSAHPISQHIRISLKNFTRTFFVFDCCIVLRVRSGVRPKRRRITDADNSVLDMPHMIRGARRVSPLEWQPETLDPIKGTVIWKLQKSLCGLRSAPRRWQDHLELVLSKCGVVPNMLDTCLWTRTTKRVSLVVHVPRG